MEINLSEYSDFTRNFLGGMIPSEEIDEVLSELGIEKAPAEAYPAKLLGEMLEKYFHLKSGLVYTPKVLRYCNTEVWFGYLRKKVHFNADRVETTVTFAQCREYPWLLIGKVLEYFGLMEFEPQMTGAEAQDYSQTDSDIEPDNTIGYNI